MSTEDRVFTLEAKVESLASRVEGLTSAQSEELDKLWAFVKRNEEFPAIQRRHTISVNIR